MLRSSEGGYSLAFKRFEWVAGLGLRSVLSGSPPVLNEILAYCRRYGEHFQAKDVDGKHKSALLHAETIKWDLTPWELLAEPISASGLGLYAAHKSCWRCSARRGWC